MYMYISFVPSELTKTYTERWCSDCLLALYIQTRIFMDSIFIIGFPLVCILVSWYQSVEQIDSTFIIHMVLDFVSTIFDGVIHTSKMNAIYEWAVYFFFHFLIFFIRINVHPVQYPKATWGRGLQSGMSISQMEYEGNGSGSLQCAQHGRPLLWG